MPTIWSTNLCVTNYERPEDNLGLLMQVMSADCPFSTDSERFPPAAGLCILIGAGPRNSSTVPRLTFLLLHFEFPGKQSGGSNWPLFVVISDDHHLCSVRMRNLKRVVMVGQTRACFVPCQ